MPALLWLWVGWHLHDEWSLNAQYNYGWVVPVLALLLWYLRWQDAPPVAPEDARSLRWLQRGILLVLLPVRVIEEANPDWRFLGWFLAILVVLFSL
ncbi:MAG: exosortase, partial [Verrucomicrobiota bacterium]|nr:exosortase [Verrucomicrobiota bacterium]